MEFLQTMESDEPYKYRAFISYSHADAKWASWLHKALETYKVPKRLIGTAGRRGTVPARLFPVFLDRDELAGSPELSGELQLALRQSQCLIVICSTSAAKSRWVTEEIQYFKALGRSDQVFALIVSGEPHGQDAECFPPALKFHVDANGCLSDRPAEPIAADARKDKDGKSLARLKLISGLLGVGLDELRQRDIQAKNRRLVILSAVSSSVAAMTIVLAVMAMKSRDEALAVREQAEGLVQFMLGDLRDKLQTIGRLDVLDDVGDQAMGYFSGVRRYYTSDSSLAAQSLAILQIGDVRLKQGMMQDASEAFSQAFAMSEELADRHPQESEYLIGLAQSAFGIGATYLQAGDADQAKRWFSLQLATVERIFEFDPGNEEALLYRGVALSNLGAARLSARELNKALTRFHEAREVFLTAIAKDSGNLDAISGIINPLSWLAAIYIDNFYDWETALTFAQEEAQWLQSLVSSDPGNIPYRYGLLLSLMRQTYCRAQLGRLDSRDDVLSQILMLSESFISIDPENVDYLRNRATAINYLSLAQEADSAFSEARSSIEESLELQRYLHRLSPDRALFKTDLINGLNRSLRLAWLSDDNSMTEALIEEAETLLSGDSALDSQIEVKRFDFYLTAAQMSPNSSARARYLKLVAQEFERFQAVDKNLHPESSFRYFALNGRRDDAQKVWYSLIAIGEPGPFLRRFCSERDYCS